MTIYLLYYDMDTGSHENWNLFYTPVEAYSTKEKREERIEYIKTKMGEENLNKINFGFHTEDVVIDIPVDSELGGRHTFDDLQEYIDEEIL